MARTTTAPAPSAPPCPETGLRLLAECREHPPGSEAQRLAAERAHRQLVDDLGLYLGRLAELRLTGPSALVESLHRLCVACSEARWLAQAPPTRRWRAPLAESDAESAAEPLAEPAAA